MEATIWGLKVRILGLYGGNIGIMEKENGSNYNGVSRV